MMNYTFISATILLVLIADPIGNIPIFANALKHVAPQRRAWVILREILIAFALLLTFMFVGDSFLRVMNLSELSLQMGGGVILFLIALRMEWIAALCVIMAISALVLVSAERIQRVVGARFVVALERLMGLVLVSVSIEMMLRGAKTFALQVART
jgi:small neutral amino acid transporter SnatA (MarC family)